MGCETAVNANGGAPILNGGPGTTGPPQVTALGLTQGGSSAEGGPLAKTQKKS